jgi:hypothetical protein
MKKMIHMEMAYQVIADFSAERKNDCLEFLIEGVVSPLWSETVRRDRNARIRQLKEWMDMPDDKKHSSKMSNDHSYKLEKAGDRLKIRFAKTDVEQATVLSRLKHSAREIKEWKEEDEYRVCALELLKSVHWVVDFNSPAHVCAGWDDACHSKSESDFDGKWRGLYDKSRIAFGRKAVIKDSYRWAKAIAEKNYERHLKLKRLYEDGRSIADPANEEIAREVIFDIAQNLADYLAYTDKRIDFKATLAKLKTVNAALEK